MRSSLLVAIIFIFLNSTRVEAVIVAGAKGGGNTSNNTTASSLNAWLASEGMSAFPYFDNVINYSDATGIYLGATASGDIWVMSARHVTDSNASITIQLKTYDFQSRTILADSDIELIRYRHSLGETPNLPVVSLATGIPSTSDPIVMIGIGKNRVQDATTDDRTSDAVIIASGQAGYNWDTAKVKRWGTNNKDDKFIGNPANDDVETYSLGGYNTTGYSMLFDEPQNPPNPLEEGPWLTTNEAMGSLGDSGGGAFYYNGSEWVLSGIYTAITTFPGQTGSTSAFGNRTLTTEISTYKSQIDGATGALVPEPSTGILLLGTWALFALMRRRNK